LVTENEILRIVDTIHRDKNIDKEIVFRGIEAALLLAARKHYGQEEGLSIEIDRNSGAIRALRNGEPIHPEELGRIAAQIAKQVITQKIREAERDVIFSEYESRIGTIVSGTVQRMEGSSIIVNLGRAEGFLPRHEQIFSENYRIGERIRALILEVEKAGTQVRIILSRTHPDFVRRLFELEVPEISEKVVEIKGLAREPGHRTKIAVASSDAKVDSVGACVGVRGSRIRNIVDKLNGEKIDIVRWSDSVAQFIVNALKPAEVESLQLDEAAKKALVIVGDDQLSLAIGKRGQNVRLASKLTGWEIDVTSPAEMAASRKAPSEEVREKEGPAACPEKTEGERVESENQKHPQTEKGSPEDVEGGQGSGET